MTLLVAAPSAYAATITVNTLADELNADGDCSLREAIEAANTNTAVDACPAGDPAPTVDVITFGVSGTIALTGLLPPISEDLRIDGPGAGSLTISGEGVVRVLEVSAGATVHVEDVTVANGNSGNFDYGGGGIANRGTLFVRDSTFNNNSSTIHGGAIWSESATLTVTDSTFSANSARIEGGAINNAYFNTATVTGSTFTDNVAGNGGGISSFGPASLTVTNSTFSRNSAGGDGGAIHNYWSTTLTNSTLSGNSAGGNGGGIASSGSFGLQNTIVASSPSGGNCFGTVGDGGGNLSWPDATCPGLNADPLLDPAGLQDNGGPTQTIAIQPGSPAIDFAVACPPPATDQRGVARPQGPACDSGAYERETVVRVPQHFQSYDLNEPERVTESGVTLIDQFGTRTVRLEEVEWLMNPAEKRRAGTDPEPIQRPDEHLTCYGVGVLPSANRTVRVRNQFVGNSTLRIGRPLTLCAPAAKTITGTPGSPPTGLDHFECYDVTGETPLFRSETLTVRDEFGTRTIRIDRARELCNPAEKRRTGRPAEPIVHPDEHLVCYRIVSHTPAFSALNVFTRDQFGLDTLRVVAPRRLCVPSEEVEGAASG